MRSSADFLMTTSKNRRARPFHIRDEIEAEAIAVEGLSYEQDEASYIHRRAIERAAQIISEAAKAAGGLSGSICRRSMDFHRRNRQRFATRITAVRRQAILGNRDNTSAGYGARRSTDDCRARRLNLCPG
jgi:hypothetical protein